MSRVRRAFFLTFGRFFNNSKEKIQNCCRKDNGKGGKKGGERLGEEAGKKGGYREGEGKQWQGEEEQAQAVLEKRFAKGAKAQKMK